MLGAAVAAVSSFASEPSWDLRCTAVVEHAALLREAAEFVFEGFYPLVWGKIDVSGAGGYVEDRNLGVPAARDLEGLVEEVGREFFEGDFGDAGGREVEGGSAGDDGAVGVDCDSGDV